MLLPGSGNWLLYPNEYKVFNFYSHIFGADISLTCVVHIAQGMEQRTFKNVNNYFNTKIYSYFETSRGQISNLFKCSLFFQHQS